MLKEYCNSFPDCRTFLENFFLTCGPYGPSTNFLNYLMDLDLYGSTRRQIRENRSRLINAFFDIVETAEDDSKRKKSDIPDDPDFSHYVIESGYVIGEAKEVEHKRQGISSGYVKLWGMEDFAEYGSIESCTRTFQKGMGSYTLCKKCNNDTGAWYGNRFVQFCKKGMLILKRSNYKPSLYYFMDIYPLAIIKQIVSMFLSINSTRFRDRHPDLVTFVLNRERKYLDREYRIYIYFNHSGMHRATPFSAKLDFNASTMAHYKTSYMTEISYPPFGYLMTFNSDPPDSEIVDITYFATYNYEEIKTLSMDYPVYPTHTFFPGDYRSADRILKESKEKGGIVP